MSRGYEPEEQLDPRVRIEAPERDAGARPAGAEALPEPAAHDRSRLAGPGRDRAATRPAGLRSAYEMRGRTYRLRNSEISAMVELGKFRAVAVEDLTEFAYHGASDRIRPDIENLLRQGLARMKTIPHEEMGSRKLLTLTAEGHRFLRETQSTDEGQVVYHGFASSHEAHHDADLYRLYQRAAAKIESAGGRPLRVVLECELQKHLSRDLAIRGKDRHTEHGLDAVAEKHGLQVVQGKIPVPDVRIEYQSRDGAEVHVDLELATIHYRGRGLSEKARAGFSLYARESDVSRLRKSLDQQELTAEILSL
jgi:hypothetical protein